MSLRTKIILVDDHAAVRAGYRRYLELEEEFKVVGEASNAEQAQQIIQTEDCDVIVLDISMPGQSGLDLIKRILIKWPEIKVVILSMHDSPVVAHKALAQGAKAYVTKSSDPEELIEAIEFTMGGRTYLSKDVRTPEQVELTARETDIIRLLVEGKTIDETALSLGISSKTVSNNLSQIRSKLDLQTDFELARWAIEKGLGKFGQ